MADAELVVQARFHGTSQRVEAGAVAGDDFQRDEGFLLGQRPGVNVGDVFCVFDMGFEIGLDDGRVEAGRDALNQDVRGFAGEADAAHGDDQRNHH